MKGAETAHRREQRTELGRAPSKGELHVWRTVIRLNLTRREDEE